MNELNEFPKKNIFTVPDHYFEGLTLKIQERIVEKRSLSSRIFAYPAISYVVASVVIILFATILIFDKPQPSAESLLAELTKNEIIDFFQETDLNTAEIMEVSNFQNGDDLMLENQELNFKNEVLEEELLKDDIEELI